MLDRLTRFFFQKRSPETDRAAAERELRSRHSPMRGLDPDRLASAIEGFRAGSLGPLSRIVEEFELRDDTMCSCAAKMRAAAARCPHQVLIREGVGAADRERAEAHRRALERLWARARATDALSRNAKGGFRLLMKQMMDAQSFGFAAHELVWRPTPDGSLDVTFVKVPLQFFENHTGALRYLPDPNLYDGIEMAEGEWMVTAGAGVGIAAAVAACSKRLSLQDWLLFSERCGQPGLHAATDAKQGSDQWNNLVAAVASFGRDWGIVTDMATKVETVSLANGGTPPYPALVERMDRAIAVLYRGSDLSTLSAGGGSVGASQQGEEADILEQDACEMLSETLQEQVERPFIRYVFGDEEPLAYVQVSPVSHPNLEMEMKIDQHLASLGVKLSKKEALERYQRTEASEDDPDDEPLRLAQPPAGGGFGAPGGGFGLPNEAPGPQKADSRVAKPLQNARSAPDGKSPVPEAGGALARVLEAFRSDLGPAAEELRKALALPEEEMRAACKDLADRLPDLLPADPAMAAILAEELAGAFAEAAGETISVNAHADKPAAGPGSGSGAAAGEAAIANERARCPKCEQWLDENGNCNNCHGEGKAGEAKTGEKKDDGGSPAGSAPSDPKKDEGEKKEEKPDRNASPTKPKDVTYDPEARNDGQIDFKELSFNRELADTQARKAGYAGVDDMMKQSVDVPQRRIDQLLKGFNGTCKPHEAIAAIRTRATFQAANGETVKLSEYCVRHYVCGERRDRERDAPKIENLCDFPKAVDMMRDPHVSSWHELDGERITQPPFPRKTQTHWSRKDKSGKLLAYAYTDSGLLNGWHFLKPRR